jgi:Phosphate-selective porin O and P
MIDLNDQLATANGVAGGKQTVHAAGLNWYVNHNGRFMFNYLHGDIAKQVSAPDLEPRGAAHDLGAAVARVGGLPDRRHRFDDSLWRSRFERFVARWSGAPLAGADSPERSGAANRYRQTAACTRPRSSALL